MNDEEEYEEEVEVVYAEPVWRWSWLDVPGIGLNTLGKLLINLGNGAGKLSQQFQAAANYGRQNHEYREAQRLEAAGRAEIARQFEASIGYHQPPREES